MTEHYFTDSPAATDAERRPRQLTLAGREVTVETAGGIFSPGGVDKATAILLGDLALAWADDMFLGAGLAPERYLRAARAWAGTHVQSAGTP